MTIRSIWGRVPLSDLIKADHSRELLGEARHVDFELFRVFRHPFQINLTPPDKMNDFNATGHVRWVLEDVEWRARVGKCR